MNRVIVSSTLANSFWANKSKVINPLRNYLFAPQLRHWWAGLLSFEKAEDQDAEIADYQGEKLSAGQVLVVGPGGGKKLAAQRTDVAVWVKAGGKVLALGLDDAEANSFKPMHVSTVRREHIA